MTDKKGEVGLHSSVLGPRDTCSTAKQFYSKTSLTRHFVHLEVFEWGIVELQYPERRNQ